MLSRPFIALYIAVFVATMGISMVSPLLPVYAKDMGASGMMLGLTFSSFAIVQAICAPLIGRLSDKYSRKPFIIGGLLIYLLAALGYLTAANVWQVIAFRAFSGIGTSAIFSVARAYVGEMTPRGQEGRWFGVFATADLVGFGSGPIVAGLIRQAISFDAVFVAMAIMMAASAGVVGYAVPWNQPEREARRARGEVELRVPFIKALGDRAVLALTIYMGLVALSFGASFSFLGLRLEQDMAVSPFLIGLAFSTQDLTGGLAQPLFGRLADRANRRLLVAVGLFTSGGLLLTLGMIESYAIVVFWLLMMGAATAMAQVSASAIQVVAGRRVGMGTVLGLGSTGNGLGIIFGSLVAGRLVDLHGIPAAFMFSGAVISVGALVFLALTRGLVTNETLNPDLATTEGHRVGEPAEAGAVGGS